MPLAAALVGGALPAQQRKPLVGTVVDAAGQAIAGAEITCVWSPPGGPDCGATDTVQATTDARGRFVARLLPQESYSAWAVHGPAAAARCSRVHEGASAGGDLRLVLDRQPVRRVIRLDGGEAWADAAPLRVEFSPRAENAAFWPLAADGSTPLLPDLGRLLVRDATGRALQLVLPSEPGAEPVLAVRLPQRCVVRLHVEDDHQAAVADADVYCHVGEDPKSFAPGVLFPRPPYRAMRHVGRTDALGKARLAAPVAPIHHTLLYVRKAGFAEAHLAVDVPRGHVYVDGVQRAVAADGATVVTLQPAARLQLVRKGAPLQPHAAFMTAIYGGSVPQERAMALAFAADGICEIPLPPGPIESMLHVRTTPDAAWELQRVPFASSKTTRVDLAAQRRLSLQFLDEGGGPARGMSGMLVARGTPMATTQQVVVATDQSGRLERTLGPDAWFLFLTDGVRWGRYDVPRFDDPATAPEFRATIACERFVVARLRVLGGDDKPVAGASLSSLVPLRRGGVAHDPTTAFVAQAMERLGASRPTGDDGILEVPLPGGSPVDCRALVRTAASKVGQATLVPGETVDVHLDPAAR